MSSVSSALFLSDAFTTSCAGIMPVGYNVDIISLRIVAQIPSPSKMDLFHSASFIESYSRITTNFSSLIVFNFVGLLSKLVILLITCND